MSREIDKEIAEKFFELQFTEWDGNYGLIKHEDGTVEPIYVPYYSSNPVDYFKLKEALRNKYIVKMTVSSENALCVLIHPLTAQTWIRGDKNECKALCLAVVEMLKEGDR